MGFILYLLTDSLHLLKIVLLCNFIFMFRRKKKKSTVIFTIILMFIMSLALYMCKNEMVMMAIYVIALCLFICLIYDEKKTQLILFGIWILFLVTMLDLLFTEMMHVLLVLLKCNNTIIEELVASIFSLVFIIIVGRVYKNKYSIGIKDIGLVKLSLFIVLAVADAFVVTSLVTILINEYSGKHKIMLYAILLVVIIGLLIQLVSVILLIISRDTYKEKEQITQKYLNEQINHYKYLEQREKDTKKI